MSKLPPLAQNLIAAMIGAVAPLVPGLLAEPMPTVTPKEIARVAIGAACVVLALNFKAPAKAEK